MNIEFVKDKAKKINKEKSKTKLIAKNPLSLKIEAKDNGTFLAKLSSKDQTAHEIAFSPLNAYRKALKKLQK